MLNKILITIAAIFFALLSSVVTPVSARIGGISVPTKVLHPGEHFNVTFHTVEWIINVDEYYAVFGIAVQPVTNGGLGTLLGKGYDLVAHGHSESGPGSFNVLLQILKNLSPPPRKKTKYLLTLAVLITVRSGRLISSKEVQTYLVIAALCMQAGLTNGVNVDYYKANITISP